MTGPKLRVVASCHECEHMTAEHYRIQGDSGYDVKCLHPDGKGYIGETRFDSTPQWCPLLKSALVEFGRGNPQHKVNQR